MVKDEVHSIEFWQKFYKDCYSKTLTDHMEMLDHIEKYYVNPDHFSVNWIVIATVFDRPIALKKLLDAFEVPDNLTLKEQLCWIQLMRT